MGKKGIRIKDIEHLKEIFQNFPINIQSAYLFGSRAGGDFLKESDWDILIVSCEFSTISFPERASYVLRKIPLRRVELFCYTQEEIEERYCEVGIINEALKGIRII